MINISEELVVINLFCVFPYRYKLAKKYYIYIYMHYETSHK